MEGGDGHHLGYPSRPAARAAVRGEAAQARRHGGAGRPAAHRHPRARESRPFGHRRDPASPGPARVGARGEKWQGPAELHPRSAAEPCPRDELLEHGDDTRAVRADEAPCAGAPRRRVARGARADELSVEEDALDLEVGMDKTAALATMAAAIA